MKISPLLQMLALACPLASGCGGPAPAVVDRRSAEESAREEAEAKARDEVRRKEQEQARKLARDEAMARGIKAREADDIPSAVAAFREALGLVPDDPDASAALKAVEFLDFQARGKADLEAGRPGDAARHLGEALKRNPGDQGCLDLLNRAISLWRPQLIDQGREALKAGRYPEAARLFGEAKDLSADAEVSSLFAEATYRAKLESGRRWAQAGNFAAAIPDLESALRLRPDDPEARDLLRQAREGKVRREKADYEQALAVGDSAKSRKDYSSAVSSYMLAMSKPGHDGRASQKLGQAQAGQRKKDSFERHMRQGKQMLAMNPIGAQVEFQAALMDSPGHPEAMRLLNQARQAKR